MIFDIDYFVQTAKSDGRVTVKSLTPESGVIPNLAIQYADSVLKAARRDRLASVENLKIEVDDLDDFQYFYIDDKEVTTTAWNNALVRLLRDRFFDALVIVDVS